MDDPSGAVLTKINGWFAANVLGGYTKTVVVGEVDRVIAGNVLAYFITSTSTALIQRVAEDIVAFQIGARVGIDPLDMLTSVLGNLLTRTSLGSINGTPQRVMNGEKWWLWKTTLDTLNLNMKTGYWITPASGAVVAPLNNRFTLWEMMDERYSLNKWTNMDGVDGQRGLRSRYRELVTVQQRGAVIGGVVRDRTSCLGATNGQATFGAYDVTDEVRDILTNRNGGWYSQEGGQGMWSRRYIRRATSVASGVVINGRLYGEVVVSDGSGGSYHCVLSWLLIS